MTPFQADLVLVVVTSITGTIFLFTKIGMEELSPSTFIFYRYGIGALTALLLYRKSLRSLSWPAVRAGAQLGVLLGVGATLMAYGLQYTDSGKAAFIIATDIVLVPFLVYAVSREIPGRSVWIGLITAFIGLYLLTYDPTTGFSLQYGDIFLLGAAFCFTGYIVLNSHVTRRFNVLLLTISQLSVVTLIALAWALMDGTFVFTLSSNLWLNVLYLGVVATGIRFSMQGFGQKYTSATHAGLIFALEPVFASLYGIVFLGEVLNGRQWQGCGLILLGCVVAKIRRRNQGLVA